MIDFTKTTKMIVLPHIQERIIIFKKWQKTVERLAQLNWDNGPAKQAIVQINKKVIAKLNKLEKIQNDLSRDNLSPEKLLKCLESYRRAVEELKKCFKIVNKNIEINNKDPGKKKIRELTQDEFAEVFENVFLKKPTNLIEMQWLLDYHVRSLALKWKDTSQLDQVELINSLEKLQETLESYRPGEINILVELRNSRRRISKKFENTIKAVPYLSDSLSQIHMEAGKMLKKEELNYWTKKLDRYNERLNDKLRDRDKQFDEFKAIKAREHKLRRFGFSQRSRMAEYTQEVNEEKVNYEKDLIRIKNEHESESEHKPEDMKRKIKELTPDGVSVFASPKIKNDIIKMINDQKGKIMGDLFDQGTMSELAYGFSKDWVLKMNMISNENNINPIMNKLSVYLNKANQFPSPLEICKSNNEFNLDLLTSPAAFTKPKNLDGNFTEKLFKYLDEIDPPSFIIRISEGEDRPSHSLGVVENKHGLWFHDSNLGCIFFPDNKKQARNNFSNFFTEYQNKVYGNCKQAKFTHIAGMGVEQTMGRRKEPVTYNVLSKKSIRTSDNRKKIEIDTKDKKHRRISDYKK